MATVSKPVEFAAKFASVLERISIAYEHAVREGVPEDEAFATCRDAFVKQLGVEPLRAANMTRIVVALVGARHGHEVYTKDEFGQIFKLAF